MNKKEKLLGKTLEELKDIVAQLNLPKYSASQISDWLYKKEISSISEMSNLSKKTRDLLEEHYEIGLNTYEQVQISVDGTKKYLFKTEDGYYIESAMIPDKDRYTLCISSQKGCKMNCLFCSTGKQGWQGNLTANEIINQIRSVDEFKQLTNIVYMGMGEPLDNYEAVKVSLELLTADYAYAWSPKRVTLSTIGVLPNLKRFLSESKVHLAISIHSPYEEERQQIMPVQKAYPIAQVLELIKQSDFSKQRRVSFEYIVFENHNDTPEHALALAKLLKDIPCRINLIRFHKIPDVKLNSTNEERLLLFQKKLQEQNITTTIRASRGEDIFAACGLLSTKALLKPKKIKSSKK